VNSSTKERNCRLLGKGSGKGPPKKKPLRERHGKLRNTLQEFYLESFRFTH
jgi:hypothetical protein